METEINQIIDKLSEIVTPVGTAIWETYLNQMIIEGYSSIITGLLVFIIFAYTGKKLYTAAITFKLKSNKSNEEIEGFYWLGFLACMAILFITAFNIKNGILHIYNPEYYVIQEIIRNIKP